MKKRPLLIILLATFHIIQPIINIIYLRFTTNYDFSILLSNIIQLEGIKTIFDFWFIFPLSGIALLLMKKWSWPIFIVIQLYSLYLHIFYEKFTWPYVSEYPMPYSIFVIIMNIFVLFYVFLPGIRDLFFDRTKRWWETHKRYYINIPCNFQILDSGHTNIAKLINISKTGVFIESNINLITNTGLLVRFNFDNLDYALEGKLISIHSINNIRGLGIEFNYNEHNKISKTKINKLIQIIKMTDPPIPTTN